MRISKILASQIAHKLTSKSRDNRDKLKLAFQKAVSDAYVQQLPEKIVKMQSMFPEFFGMSYEIVLDGHGFNFTRVNTEEPVISDGRGRAFLNLNANLARMLKETQTAFQDAQKQADELVKETENSIMALGTYKQVAEHFPAAAQYLPGPSPLAIIPDLSKLTAKIKNQ